MLKSWTCWVASQRQACQASAYHLSRHPMASILTIIALAITLSLPTLFYVIADNLQSVSHRWQSNGHLMAYLKPGLSEPEANSAIEAIRSLDNIGESEVIPADQGMALLQKQPGMTNLMDYLPKNPLPTAIRIIPNKQLGNPLAIKQLKSQIIAIKQVDLVKMDQGWINQLHHLSQLMTGCTELIFILLALAVILIVVNTLRLDIQNRFEEIQVLKLIGATDAYIQRPFLYMGFYYGFIAGVLAMITINICLSFIATLVSQLAASYQIQYSLYSLTTTESLILLALSSSLGWFGAKIAVRSQLKDIEPSHLMQV
ncbi:permease-like cell division protein FtsX [Legionella sp. W05-934-2]|jgi:cell division transport system permease protein|uniref:permease-like cell division protein FtsX n=1 Tax=Legionella sp. W05-934-2 TaxID=1198649 RepID=UPI00346279A8